MFKRLNNIFCVFFATLFAHLVLFVIIAFSFRLFMLFSLKDSELSLDVDSLSTMFVMGMRFDLKIGVVFASLQAFPVLLVSLFTSSHRLVTFWQSSLWVFILLIFMSNYSYFSFYGTPFNALIFGLFDDDTMAIIRTLLSDFPVLKMTLFIVIASVVIMKIHKQVLSKLKQLFLRVFAAQKYAVLGYLIFCLTLGFMAKGTVSGVALQRQHMVVSNNQFLNNLVPNAISALYYAIAVNKNEPTMSDSEFMVRQLGFESIFDVAKTLGIHVNTHEALLNAFYVSTKYNQRTDTDFLIGKKEKNIGYEESPFNILKHTSIEIPQDLVFFLMESMGQEPFLYQSPQFDVLGDLAEAKTFACHFDNFDSIQNGTFPSLEGILYHSPITPLTQGRYAYQTMPWSVAMSLQNAGYHTVFFTGGRANWRNLDQSLPHQGFDEILDAGYILENYPESYLDMWGVPDEFLFQAISDYRQQYQKNRMTSLNAKPLFIFVLTVTNHPPYSLPKWQQNASLDLTFWQGDKSDPLLEKNLNTFRYSANALGEFVLNAKEEIFNNQLIIAATGDHNARTFGRYSSSQRVHLANQVPFLVWANLPDCGEQLHFPASHRDMFPTLFELLNAPIDYLKTGVNLFEKGVASKEIFSLQFSGNARNQYKTWQISADTQENAKLLSCEQKILSCNDMIKQIQLAKAYLAFADWHIRYQLSQQE